MSEPTVYRPGVNTRPRRKEQVVLPGGEHFVWVWEMTVADQAQVLDRSERPQLGSVGGGHSKGKAIAVQIMLCCYDSDADGAKRIFSDADFGAVYDLPYADFDVLYEAANRVNGKISTEQERLRDFLTVTEAPSSS
jgi:hypothetical protein